MIRYAVEESLGLVMALLAFRSIPFVAYALLSKRVGARAKLLSVVVLCLLALGARSLGAQIDAMLLGMPVALAYFGLVALLVYELTEILAQGRITQLALFCILSASCVLLPAVLAPASFAFAVVLIGWDVLLSSYSYCLENRTKPLRPSRSDCAFFLLVNPTLVYPERGIPCPTEGRTSRGLLRCSIGVVAWLAQDALVALSRNLSPSSAGLAAWPGYSAFLLYYSVSFGAYYLAHSGLASVQIGLMTLTGYTVPERYHYPFLATSPQDFWRRWNTWVTSWVRRYVFLPLNLAMRRRARRWPGYLITGIAVMATFLVVGLLHDLSTYATDLSAAERRIPVRGSVLFLSFGALLVVWAAAERLRAVAWVRRLAKRVPLRVALACGIVAVLHAHFLIHAGAMSVVKGLQRRTADAPVVLPWETRVRGG